MPTLSRTINSSHLTVNRKAKPVNLLICKLLTAQRKYKGFTLIELLVVMGIFAIMVGFVSINLLRPQHKANLDTTVTTLVADLREQQIRAMAGDGPSDYGVDFAPDHYTLFTGSSPSANPSSNFQVNMEGPITISVNPSSPTYIVFAQKSGQITQATTITITNTASGESKTIGLNTLGSPTIQ